jgi:xanthine/uracil permease
MYFATYLGIIYIDERPPVFQCLLMGVQHVLAMFGSTVIGKHRREIE